MRQKAWLGAGAPAQGQQSQRAFFRFLVPAQKRPQKSFIAARSMCQVPPRPPAMNAFELGASSKMRFESGAEVIAAAATVENHKPPHLRGWFGFALLD